MSVTETSPRRRLAAILAADVAGYSRLMSADDSRTLASLDAARGVFRAETQARQGRVIDMAGDSVLAVFESATAAVETALAVQDTLGQEAARVPEERRMQFRIGVHLGDVIEKADGTVYGDGVNIAARLQTLAQPGGVAVSQAVEGVVRGKVAARFDDGGEHAVKNIAQPVRAYFAHAAELRPSTGSGTIAAPTLPDRPSIAVLPFTNMSGDAEQEYFADGMAEDIITALSRFQELFVIARNSSFVYKGRAVDIQQVARELGVRYVLEGSVRKAGSRVRITGQLIDAATRAHLWADRFDGALDDVFDLQDRVTERVVGALQPTLREAEIERARRKHPASLDAYDYLLRALPLVIANSLADAESAIKLLGEALRLNPDYAYAHALMSMAYGQIFRSAAGPAREVPRAKSVAHARRALEMAGDDSNALAYAGFIVLLADQDIAAARAALDRAVALTPNSASAYGYRALVLSMVGEAGQAIEDANRALRLSPLDATNYQPQMALVIAHIVLARFDEAVAWAHKAIQSAPPRYPMSYAWLIVAECGRGNAAEAERQVKRLAEILPNFTGETLQKLFDIFPPALRTRALELMRGAEVCGP